MNEKFGILNHVFPKEQGEIPSERERTDEELLDPLTGLYNREAFFREVNHVLRENPEETKWMILINIKDFKLINNIYGTDFGDQILKLHGELIHRLALPDTIKGRIFGDKFVLLIRRNEYDKELFLDAMDILNGTLQEMNYKPSHHVVACDVTGAKLSAENLYNCLSIGEREIQSKHERAFIECDYGSIEKEYMEYVDVLSQFDAALLQNQFKMFLQPHVDGEGHIVGAEALVRWDRLKKGIVLPGDFIPLIEQSGLIYKLDCYMWNMAARQVSQWRKMGYTDRHISVNVSSVDFYNVDVVETFVRLAREYDIPASSLILEITETAVIQNIDSIVETVKKLKQHGFKVAMDDFGKGYSSLNMIVDIPFDIIKFDKAFVQKTEEKKSRSKIVIEELVGIVKKLGAVTIFEGVETREQFEQLRSMGVELFQGYYFSKPLPSVVFNEIYAG